MNPLVKRSIVIQYSPLIIIQHRILIPVIKSTLRHHNLSRIARIIRIFIQEFIIIPNLCIHISPVSLCRIRLIVNSMFPGCLHVAHRTQSLHFQSLQWTNFQLGLEFSIQHINIQLIRVQLVQNTKRSIVHRVIFVIPVIIIRT